MKVYISHPIAGQSEAAKSRAESIGAAYARGAWGNVTVVRPRRIPPACGAEGGCAIRGRDADGKHTVQCYMRGDIAELLTCDAIVMCPGWAHSSGCRDEINVAAMCGIPIYYTISED